MRKAIAGVLLILVLIGMFMAVRTLRYGFSAHDEPTAIEAVAARSMRHLAVPSDLRGMKNPVALTPEVLAEARAHFADHCANCHGNDGRGKTEMGAHLYPRATDLARSETQSLSDGELFATIENGVRLSGMPGFGNGTASSGYASWTLVHFIRHLPQITPDELKEMESLNPVSPAERKEEQDEELFLQGDETTTAAPLPHGSAHH